MNRNRWLLTTVVLLLAANVVWHIYARWGLITVHANPLPLSDVIRSIERQGGISLRTNLPPDTAVTMNVNHVPLSEALETLSVVTESNWRLNYVVGPTKNDVLQAVGTLSAGQSPEGWKTEYFPIRQILDEEFVLPDPRRDKWEVKDTGDKTAQAYLMQGARSVSAGFTYPAEWNPAITSSLSTGTVHKLVPKLAHLAHGDYQEIFLLIKSRRREEVADGENGPRNGSRDREGMQQRIQAELAKMPEAQRASVQADLDELRQLRQGLAGATPEERAAKFDEMREQPKFEDKMEQKQLGRESRMTPEQRLARAQSYAQHRQDIRTGQ